MNRTAQSLLEFGSKIGPTPTREEGTGEQATLDQNSYAKAPSENTTQQNRESAPDGITPVSVPSNDQSNHTGSTAADNQVEKWQLNFERFLQGIQCEPELCQFFAEQYQMNLANSSNFNPSLGSYTKTFMVKPTK